MAIKLNGVNAETALRILEKATGKSFGEPTSVQIKESEDLDGRKYIDVFWKGNSETSKDDVRFVLFETGYNYLSYSDPIRDEEDGQVFVLSNAEARQTFKMVQGSEKWASSVHKYLYKHNMAPQVYQVKNGDGLERIAKRFSDGTNQKAALKSLLELNGLEYGDTIHPGQTLLIGATATQTAEEVGVLPLNENRALDEGAPLGEDPDFDQVVSDYDVPDRYAGLDDPVEEPEKKRKGIFKRDRS